jgi:uncharacterized protein HemX
MKPKVIKWLLAVMLSLVLGFPGSLWGQVTQSRGRYADSPRRADKSFSTDRQKKGQKKVRNRGQKSQTQKKMRRMKAGTATQTQTPTKSKGGGSTGSAGK